MLPYRYVYMTTIQLTRLQVQIANYLFSGTVVSARIMGYPSAQIEPIVTPF